MRVGTHTPPERYIARTLYRVGEQKAATKPCRIAVGRRRLERAVRDSLCSGLAISLPGRRWVRASLASLPTRTSILAKPPLQDQPQPSGASAGAVLTNPARDRRRAGTRLANRIWQNHVSAVRAVPTSDNLVTRLCPPASRAARVPGRRAGAIAGAQALPPLSLTSSV